MKLGNSNLRYRQNASGSALLEAPLAMLILFVFILFPLMAMLGLTIKYGCCYTLHQLQVREASLLPRTQAQAADGPVKNRLPREWKSEGMGSFVELTSDLPDTRISYEEGNLGANGVRDQFVIVQTTFSMKPFLSVSVPNLTEVPGLNGPLIYSFESRRPMENPTNLAR